MEWGHYRSRVEAPGDLKGIWWTAQSPVSPTGPAAVDVLKTDTGGPPGRPCPPRSGRAAKHELGVRPSRGHHVQGRGGPWSRIYAPPSSRSVGTSTSIVRPRRRCRSIWAPRGVLRRPRSRYRGVSVPRRPSPLPLEAMRVVRLQTKQNPPSFLQKLWFHGRGLRGGMNVAMGTLDRAVII